MRVLFWNGRAPNFQTVFDNFLQDFKNVLDDGIRIEKINLTLKVKLHGFIADSQARPKVINSIQYNGHYGCLHCLNSGYSYSQGKRVYHYLPNVEIRDNEIYKNEIAISNRKPFEGIKRGSCLSIWLKIPEHVVLDYMHLSLEGFVKQISSIWLDSKNHKKEYYIGKASDNVHWSINLNFYKLKENISYT